MDPDPDPEVDPLPEPEVDPEPEFDAEQAPAVPGTRFVSQLDDPQPSRKAEMMATGTRNNPLTGFITIFTDSPATPGCSGC